MDGALSSTRYNRDANTSSGGGGGNFNVGRRGGRGGGRGGGRHYNSNRRGPYQRQNNHRRHHHHGHHHHRNHHGHHHDRNHHRGGNNHRGNRFQSNSNRTSSVHPQNAMWVQLSAMVAQMSVSSSNQREVVQNMMDLIKVLTADNNAPLFLNDKLYQLIVHCASALPLHTPNYAALTFGLQQYSPFTKKEEEPTTQDPTTAAMTTTSEEESQQQQQQQQPPILQSCLQHACERFGQDLDILLDKMVESTSSTATPSLIADAFLRAKLLLRFFTLLSHIGIVPLHDDNEANNNGDEKKGFSLCQFLIWLMEQNNVICTGLVYSTIPYLLSSNNSEIKEWIQQNLLHHPTNTVTDTYKSIYEPGYGIHSLLLQEEQLDPNNNDDDEEEEDSDEEEDEEDAPACADTFMDLHRTVTQMVGGEDNDETTSFALLTNAPWSQLWARKQESKEGEGDDDNDAMVESDNIPLEYTDPPLRLFTQGNETLLFSPNHDDEEESSNTVVSCKNIDAIIFGRLSLFGLPNDDDDDEDDEEEQKKDETNTQLNAFQKSFTMMDRFFLSESIRDVLLCHRSRISDTGVDKGTTKDVAEQIWSLSQSFHADDNNDNNDNSGGMEYGIVETMLSLLLQQTSSLSHIYLSKVLLDLTKLQPSTIPQALAVAVSSLTMDYLPNLVPSARDNLSSWFAFHLTNTDYQWPSSYWKISSSSPPGSCQSHFIRRTLFSLSSLVSSPSLLLTDCFPPTTTDSSSSSSSSLVLKWYPTLVQEEQSQVQLQLQKRIWKQLEDVDSIREYMVGDDVSSEEVEDPEDNYDQIWWRTGFVIRALLLPAKKEWNHQQKSLQQVQQQQQQQQQSTSDQMMEEDDHHDKNEDDDLEVWKEEDDILSEIRDVLERYRPVLLATLAKDTQVQEENLQLKGSQQPEEEGALLLLGEISILQQLSKCTAYSPHVIFTHCLETLIQTQIVSPMAVCKWLLQHETTTTNKDHPYTNNNDFAHQWWTFASLSIRVGMTRIAMEAINNIQSTNNNNDNSMGMVIDTFGSAMVEEESKIVSVMDENPSFQRLKKIVAYVTPLLQYVSQSVCTMLVDIHTNSQQEKMKGNPKRLLAMEVDLVEGFKHLIRSVLFEIHQTYMKVTDESTNNEEENGHLQQKKHMATWLSNSAIGGQELAKHCRSSCANLEGTPAAELVIHSLNRL